MRGSRASRTATRTPSDSVFSVVILNSRTVLLLRLRAGRNTSACGSGRRRSSSGCGAVSVPLGVSTAPLASASTLNIGTLTDWANPRKFTLGLLRVNLRRTQPEQMSSGLPLKADIAQYRRHFAFVPVSEVAAPIRLFRPSGRPRWGGSRLITDRAAFWCATPHRMVNETEELDRWSPQSHRPSLAVQSAELDVPVRFSKPPVAISTGDVDQTRDFRAARSITS
jgi:hypothetical protein